MQVISQSAIALARGEIEWIDFAYRAPCNQAWVILQISTTDGTFTLERTVFRSQAIRVQIPKGANITELMPH